MTTTAELKSQVDAKGEEIVRISHEIESRVEEYMDWQNMVRKHPLKSMGIAVGAGLLFSGAMAPLVRSVGYEAGAVLRSSATAYLLGLVASRSPSQTG